MNIMILLPFGSRCIKCGLPAYATIRHCRGCDELMEKEHLHKGCVCGWNRIEECIDPAEAAKSVLTCNHAPGVWARLKRSIRYVFRGE